MGRPLLLTTCLALLASQAPAAGVSPSDVEADGLGQLTGQVSGQIVWESNRDGGWQLYTMNADGTGARRLTSGPGEYSQAAFSPDGELLLCTRTDGNTTSVWMMNADGTDPQKVMPGALDPHWRKGGKAIHVRKQPDKRKKQWQTFEVDLYSGEERLMFPPRGVELSFEPWSADANDDGTRFVAWSPRPRGTWVISADGKLQKHVHGGCEGQISPDRQYGFGVKTAGQFIRFNLSDGEDSVIFNERTGDWSHTYFPHVTADGQWLIYGACPPNQHDQDRSDYEIFLVRLQDWQTVGEPVRLTYNTKTDRWPAMHIGASRLPDGPPDVAGNRATNPPPGPKAILSFASDNAKPDASGDWGLWPQQEGCRGDATWVAEDAEGGDGGSMKIDYTIAQAPSSFSLWIAPGDLDLSAYGHVVVYAKGDVPSFTLVVKDANLKEPDDPDGIADGLVEGVTGDWQRFELPFSGFASRKQGAKVDWRTVNHFGICMISPRNEQAGTLWVDNLQVIE